MSRFSLLALVAGFIGSAAVAHTPLCECSDNGDGTITCEGGFSDGASAAGVTMRIIDELDRVLLEGRMNADSEFSFPAPTVGYHVVFDAGQNHVVVIYGGDID